MLQAWLLVIQSEFQSLEDRDALISHVKAVAVESACNEPRTLGFQVSAAPCSVEPIVPLSGNVKGMGVRALVYIQGHR